MGYPVRSLVGSFMWPGGNPNFHCWKLLLSDGCLERGRSCAVLCFCLAPTAGHVVVSSVSPRGDPGWLWTDETSGRCVRATLTPGQPSGVQLHTLSRCHPFEAGFYNSSLSLSMASQLCRCPYAEEGFGNGFAEWKFSLCKVFLYLIVRSVLMDFLHPLCGLRAVLLLCYPGWFKHFSEGRLENRGTEEINSSLRILLAQLFSPWILRYKIRNLYSFSPLRGVWRGINQPTVCLSTQSAVEVLIQHFLMLILLSLGLSRDLLLLCVEL